MLVLTAHHFQFADNLIRNTPVFKQSLVIHSCMHLRQEIGTFKNSTPELIWARILAGVNLAFLDDVHYALLCEIALHASQLIAHDNPNIILGVINGVRSTKKSNVEIALEMIEQKQLHVTEDAFNFWCSLLVKEGMNEQSAHSIVTQWIKQNAQPE